MFIATQDLKKRAVLFYFIDHLHQFCKKAKTQIELRKADNEHADSRIAKRVCFTPRRVCGKQIFLKQIYLSSVVNIKPTIMKMSGTF